MFVPLLGPRQLRERSVLQPTPMSSTLNKVEQLVKKINQIPSSSTLNQVELLVKNRNMIPKQYHSQFQKNKKIDMKQL